MLPVETIRLDELPHGWPDNDSGLTSPAVPSAVIRYENNYILNPQHPEFGNIRFCVPATEQIDRRLYAK